MRAMLSDLDDDCVQVLETVLETRGLTSGITLRAADVGLTPVASAGEAQRRVRNACEKLEVNGFLPAASWNSLERGYAVGVSVPAELHGIDHWRVLDMVREELRSRGIPLRSS